MPLVRKRFPYTKKGKRMARRANAILNKLQKRAYSRKRRRY